MNKFMVVILTVVLLTLIVPGAYAAQVGMSGIPEKTEILQLVLSIRFMQEQPKLGLDDKQTDLMLEKLYDYLDRGYFFRPSSFGPDTIDELATALGKDKDLLLSEKNSEFPRGAGLSADPAAREKRFAEMATKFKTAIADIRGVLNRDQLKYVDSLDLGKFIDLSSLSFGGGAGAGMGSGQPQPALDRDNQSVLLFEELIWLLLD